MKKTIVPIKGMHCKSCELLIGEQLEAVQGVKNYKISAKHKEAVIYSKHEINMDEVKEAVVKAGYEVGVDDSKDWISRKPQDFVDLGVASLILVVFYVVVSKLGLFNLNVAGSNSPSSLLVVLLVGLTAGFSTCMALVGGLVLGISARHAEKHPEATAMQKFKPHLFFNMGRIGAYFLLGGLIGVVGKVFQLSGPVLGVLTMLVGVVMFSLGLKLIEIFPHFSNSSFTLPASIGRILGIKRNEKEYSHKNSMLVGALTFFLPCGFTQAMQLYAMSTGNFWSGAFIMATFAIGTAPGLLGIGGLTSVLKGSFAKKFYKFAGLLVMFLAIFNIGNGFNLTGWTIDVGSTQETEIKNVRIENGVQIAEMKQTASGYIPNKFVIKKGIPVKWVINATDLNSCSAGILMSKMGISKRFTAGENIIEFTPTETGKLKFSCLMGMYPGEFTVIDDGVAPSVKNEDGKVKEVTITQKPEPVAQSGDVQIVRTVFASNQSDISPKNFTVQAGKPVDFIVDVQEDGYGCMSTIMIPGLVNSPEYLEKGKKIEFKFTPAEKGQYEITCAMGVPRGTLTVI